MSKVMLDIALVYSAWLSWRDYFDVWYINTNPENELEVFCDFCDPVRQTAIRETIDWYGPLWDVPHHIEVPEQVARRVELLAGPYYYAVLKANLDKMKQARTSWGKK